MKPSSFQFFFIFGVSSLLTACAHNATVSGTVHLKSGPPVAGVEVHMYDGFAAIFAMHEIKKGSVFTDANGRFSFKPVRYSHTLGLRIFGTACHFVGDAAITEKDTTPPETYQVDMVLLDKNCAEDQKSE